MSYFDHIAPITFENANYVLWGGREGYDTLLNTDLKRDHAQLGHFFQMAVEHKHKIGFHSTILIEPKPQEPTKHQYDYMLALALEGAAKMIERDTLAQMKGARYADWDGEFDQQVLTGNFTLETLAAEAAKRGLRPQHVSSRHEALENLVNRYSTIDHSLVAAESRE
ncbi:MAG: hypothetical protein EPN69_13545 [Rhodanobacter sp.]|nr:MAG: hypothetical protein EPN71_16560 [Rhodanobacter sp.]TAL89792.1 MAG: hypothetical protein EPN69_13545 [Rhodanobacter sp.]TAM42888.1 MAG: hypothetical protein EPN58_01375 [Rhodanobacter sp.]